MSRRFQHAQLPKHEGRESHQLHWRLFSTCHRCSLIVQLQMLSLSRPSSAVLCSADALNLLLTAVAGGHGRCGADAVTVLLLSPDGPSAWPVVGSTDGRSSVSVKQHPLSIGREATTSQTSDDLTRRNRSLSIRVGKTSSNLCVGRILRQQYFMAKIVPSLFTHFDFGQMKIFSKKCAIFELKYQRELRH